MSVGPGRSRGRVAAAAIFASALAVACAGTPEPVRPPSPETAAAQSPSSSPVSSAVSSPVSPPVSSGGTAIKIAEPAVLSKAREERAAIEAAISFASPTSLDRARELVAASSALKPEELRSLDLAALAMESLVYPTVRVSEELSGVPPASAAWAILEAKAGRTPTLPAATEGTALGELIPALVLYGSDSRDSARKAQEALTRFERMGIPSVVPDLILGLDAERRGESQAAFDRYAKALALAPDAWAARLGQGRIYLGLGRPVEALEALEAVSTIDPGTLAFDRPFARALYECGRFAEAEPLVTRVLTEDPQDAPFLLIRAHLLVLAKSYQQAMSLLNAYATVDPGNRLFLLLRCNAAEGLRSRDEALRWARKGLESFPDDPEFLVAAARILFQGTGPSRDEARAFAARACSLVPPSQTAAPPGMNPAQAKAWAASGPEGARLLAVDAASRYDWATASAYLGRALAAGAFEDKALAATIYRKSKDGSAALAYSAGWYAAEPGSEAAAEAYLRALVDARREQEALDLSARLLAGRPSAPFRSTIFYLQSLIQKNDDAAIALLRSALIEDADDAEALLAMYDIQYRRKDYAKARFYLKQASILLPGDPDVARRQREIDAAPAQ